MEIVKTALGRYVPAYEAQTILEDAILALLYRQRMDVHPSSVPMKLSEIVRAARADEALVVADLDALKESIPPRVEERIQFEGERAFRIPALASASSATYRKAMAAILANTSLFCLLRDRRAATALG